MQNLVHKSKEWAGTAAIAYYKYLSELFSSSSVCQLECSCCEREVRDPSSPHGETTGMQEMQEMQECRRCPDTCHCSVWLLEGLSQTKTFHHFRQCCQSSSCPGWSTQLNFRLLSLQTYKLYQLLGLFSLLQVWAAEVWAVLLSMYNLQSFLLILPGVEWLGIVPALSSCICDKTHPFTSHVQLTLSG